MKHFRNRSRRVTRFQSRSADAVRQAAPAAAAAAALPCGLACAARATRPIEAGMGSVPALPEPATSTIPEINIPEATGWPENRRPIAAGGTQVAAFATELRH